MKIILNKEFEQYKDFVENIPNIFDKEGSLVYQSRNVIKSFDVDGTTLNVKSYKIPILINKIVYTFFRKSKARRAYEYALELMERGFLTPTPIAYIETKKFGLLNRSFFISLHTPMQGNMRLINDGDKSNEGKEELIKAFAEYTAQLHEAGILHCDYSPGNILYEKYDENGVSRYRFSLIDINRMQFRPVSIEMGCENFGRMRGNDEFFKMFATYYAQARKGDVDRCVTDFLYYKREDRRKRERKKKFKTLKKKLLGQ